MPPYSSSIGSEVAAIFVIFDGSDSDKSFVDFPNGHAPRQKRNPIKPIQVQGFGRILNGKFARHFLRNERHDCCDIACYG